MTDLAGNAITEALVGDTVQLRGYVQAVQAARNVGVFAGYTDVLFTNPDLVSLRAAKANGSPSRAWIGTFRLGLDGQMTAPISLEGDVRAAIQGALEALPNVGAGNVMVIPGFADYQIKFRGALWDQDISPLIVDGTGTTATVTVEDDVYPADPSVLLSAVTMAYDTYWNGKSGQLEAAGHWSDVGAFTASLPGGPGDEYLLFTADLAPRRPACWSSVESFADGSPTLLFNGTAPTADQVGFHDSVSLTIVSPTPGIRVTSTGPLETGEDGSPAIFAVALQTAPTSDVTIAVSSSDETEGTASSAELTFTPDNWGRPQLVIVTGADDYAWDGDQAYAVVLDRQVRTRNTTGWTRSTCRW